MDYDTLQTVMRRLALEAGDKIMEIYNSDDFEVKTKSDESPVTVADEAADALIAAGLRAAFPDATIHVEGDDGAHFAAEVTDESFRGKNRVQQQRAVMAALKGKMDGSNGELHALALTTKAPE